MSDAIFVGFDFKDVWEALPNKPTIAFKDINAAVKWKAEKGGRDFVLIPVQ